MSDDKKLDYKVQRWVANKERSLAHKWYAIARIDLLIISISGGAIYLLFELMKYYKSNNLDIDVDGLKVSGIFFTLAVLVNFVSQFCGYYANEYEARYNNSKFLEAIDEKRFNSNYFDKLDISVKAFNKWVNGTNWISIISMMLGIILLVAHTYMNI